MPKKTPKDTHKARKPHVSQLELQKTFFFEKKLGKFFLGKSHSAEKETFSLKTTFLKLKTDRKAGTYPLIK